MARLALRILATTELLHGELRALDDVDDFRRDARAGQRRLTDLDIRAVARGQDAIEGHLVAPLGVAEVDGDFLTFTNFVLLAAVDDDRVHGKPNYFADSDLWKLTKLTNLPPRVEGQEPLDVRGGTGRNADG